MKNKTIDEYNQVIEACKDVFLKKTKDYGTAWRILRLPSITDQIFMKAQRIRTIQEKGKQKVEEDIANEFIGIINYCLIAIIQLSLSDNSEMDLNVNQVKELYVQYIRGTQELLLSKNHDYDEAWRDMRVPSMTDIILMKILRVKQIEDNKGKTIISEGVKSNYQDTINYSVFCLIKSGYVNTKNS